MTFFTKPSNVYNSKAKILEILRKGYRIIDFRIPKYGESFIAIHFGGQVFDEPRRCGFDDFIDGPRFIVTSQTETKLDEVWE